MEGTARVQLWLTKVIDLIINNKSDQKITKHGIKAGLLNENEKKLTQTKTYPLTVSPLIYNMGLLGKGKDVSNILKGSSKISENTEQGLQESFDHLKRPDAI